MDNSKEYEKIVAGMIKEGREAFRNEPGHSASREEDFAIGYAQGMMQVIIGCAANGDLENRQWEQFRGMDPEDEDAIRKAAEDFVYKYMPRKEDRIFQDMHAGWMSIKIGNDLWPASYIDDVPDMILDAYQEYQESAKALIQFDAEGWSWCLVLTDYSVYVIEEKAKTVLKTYPGIEPERLIRDMYEEIKGNTEKFADWAHGRNEDPEWYVLTLECYKAKIKSITDKELHIHKDGSQDVDREKFQDKFWEKFLDPAGFDGYGFFEKHDDPHVTDRGGYENDTFLINPYYWGDDEEIAGEPNFVYKPTGFEIRWYKYPMRGATANRAFTEEEFDQMLGECLTSMK